MSVSVSVSVPLALPDGCDSLVWGMSIVLRYRLGGGVSPEEEEEGEGEGEGEELLLGVLGLVS